MWLTSIRATLAVRVVINAGSGGELDHGADSVLRLHQLEAAVDVVKRDPVGDERVDVDLARHVAVDELRHALAPLDAAERRPGDPATGDEQPRDDVERLPFSGHTGD